MTTTAQVLALDTAATFDGLVVSSRQWSRAAGDLADQAGTPGSEAWLIALRDQPAETVILTGDGRGADRDDWCRCEAQPDALTWVRYQVWDEQGCAAHGFLCPTCRRITQTG